MADSTVTGSRFKRILLKLSGEALMGDGKSSHSIAPAVLDRVAKEIAEISRLGIEVGIVVGGGNFCRGATLSANGLDRVTSDHIGMLATVMNSLALQDALVRNQISTRVMSALPLDGICEKHNHRAAVRYLKNGKVVIFSAGTGNPFFTTDSAASLRAIEVNADVVFKATNVDGVYSADPKKDPHATRYETVSFQEAIEKELGVMDLPALCLCRDHNMPIMVFSIHQTGILKQIIEGKSVGTLVN